MRRAAGGSPAHSDLRNNVRDAMGLLQNMVKGSTITNGGTNLIFRGGLSRMHRREPGDEVVPTEWS